MSSVRRAIPGTGTPPTRSSPSRSSSTSSRIYSRTSSTGRRRDSLDAAPSRDSAAGISSSSAAGVTFYENGERIIDKPIPHAFMEIVRAAISVGAFRTSRTITPSPCFASRRARRPRRSSYLAHRQGHRAPGRPAVRARLPSCTPRVQTRRGDERIRTAVRGFAGLCLTTRPRRPGTHRSPVTARPQRVRFARGPCSVS